MATTPNYDLDIDTTLGGKNASDYVISSQKAIKDYVDNHSGGGGTSTDVQINGTSITSGGVADILTNTAYDSTTNKIATMSDLPTVPTNVSSFTNDSGYITGINSTDVTTALGYTPYDSSNPSGYTTNTGTVTSVNNVSPVNGNVTLSIPAAVTVDSALSSTSTNPVQNKVITNALNGKADDTDVIKKDGGSAQQTVSLSSGTGTTAFGVKSRATSSYISYSNSTGWIGSYGVSSDKKPTFYNGTGYTLAYTSDIPTIATSVSSSSTNAETVGAKLFYDTCGDIETLINAL